MYVREGIMKKTGFWKVLLGVLAALTVFFFPVLKSEAAGVKYDKLIFVGDSRIVELSDLVADDNTQYIAKCGVGVNWLKKSGYPKLQKAVRKTEGRKAVIFFIGINDTFHVKEYIRALNSYYKPLKKENCDVYYLSLTPTTSVGKTPSKSTESVKIFNAKVKSELKKGIRYLDIFQYFRWGINSVDGVHYTDSSYGSIHRYCLRQLKKYGTVKKGKYSWEYKNGSWYCRNRKGRLYRSRFLPLTNGVCYVNNQGKKQANKTFTVKKKTYRADRFGIVSKK